MTPHAFKTRWCFCWAPAAPYTKSWGFTYFQVLLRGGKGFLVWTQLQELSGTFHLASPDFLCALG